MPKEKIKFIMQRTVSKRNLSVYLIHFLNTITQILLDFNTKVGRKDIFKLTIRNESLHEIGYDTGVTAVNSDTSKGLTVINMFPHHSIHKYTCMSPDGKTHNQTDHKEWRLLGCYAVWLL
jgi:hypothetical protein